MKVPNFTEIPEIYVTVQPVNTLENFFKKYDLQLDKVSKKFDKLDYKEPHQLEKLSRKQLKYVLKLNYGNFLRDG